MLGSKDFFSDLTARWVGLVLAWSRTSREW